RCPGAPTAPNSSRRVPRPRRSIARGRGSRSPSRLITLPSEPEVGEGAVAVPVDDEADDLAVADSEYSGSLRLHLREIHSARFAAAQEAVEAEHARIVKLAELSAASVMEALPGVEDAPRDLDHLGKASPSARLWPADEFDLDGRVGPISP